MWHWLVKPTHPDQDWQDWWNRDEGALPACFNKGATESRIIKSKVSLLPSMFRTCIAVYCSQSGSSSAQKRTPCPSIAFWLSSSLLLWRHGKNNMSIAQRLNIQKPTNMAIPINLFDCGQTSVCYSMVSCPHCRIVHKFCKIGHKEHQTRHRK